MVSSDPTLKLVALRLKHDFATSRASIVEKENLIVRWRNGVGECAPSIHYGLPAQALKERLEKELQRIGQLGSDERFTDFISGLPTELNVARCGLEMAYLDHSARVAGQPLWTYLGLSRPGSCETSMTISCTSEKEIAAQIDEAADFSVLKLKVGFARDMWFIDEVLRRREVRLRLDANGGWTVKQARERLRSLAGYPVEFVEEPLAEPKLFDLDRLKSSADIPLFLDESVVNLKDVERYREVIDGLNLKLAKCGGLSRVAEMANVARGYGLKLLLGCMIESAIGITAALHLASLFDYLDLDAIMLTEDDPFWGAQMVGSSLVLPDGAGIGIVMEENTLA